MNYDVKTVLPTLRVVTPCSQDWSQMLGDERVRYCERCELQVYNLLDMSPEEVTTVVRERNGRVCGRLEGTRSTVREIPAASHFRLSRIAAAVFTAAMALTPAFSQVQKKSASEIAERHGKEFTVEVLDPAGEAFPGAQVSLKAADGTIVEGTTDNTGRYSFGPQKHGFYLMEISAPGFVRFSEEIQYRGKRLQVKLSMPLLGVVVIDKKYKPYRWKRG